MSLDLTMDECIRVNASLLKAVKSSDMGALKDILASLKAADVRNKLKVRGLRAGACPLCTHALARRPRAAVVRARSPELSSSPSPSWAPP